MLVDIDQVVPGYVDEETGDDIPGNESVAILRYAP